MKMYQWIIAAAFVAPLIACSSSDDSDTDNTGGTGGSAGTAGTGGSVVTGGTGGGTAGTAGTGGGTAGTAGTGGGTAGTAGTAGTGGGTSDCQLEIPGEDACNACFQAACETECVAVMGEPTFQDLLGCYQGCTDDACYTQCDTDYPAAAAAYDTFSTCMGNQCATECGGGAGACQLEIPGEDACNACFQTACEAECVAFMGDPNMNDFLACYQGCADDACYAQCDTDYPSASALFEAFNGCIVDQCADECGGGANFPICDSGLAAADEACATCAGDNCCDEAKACVADDACLDCLSDPSAAGCDSNATLLAVDECISTNCAGPCGG